MWFKLRIRWEMHLICILLVTSNDWTQNERNDAENNFKYNENN